MISAILAAGILLADTTAAVQAQAAKPTAVAPATSVAPKKDETQEMVCHSEQILGSRMPVKRCRTKGDIATQKLEDRQTLERMQIRQDPGH
ncbi:MAG TPA: hypothetical protein VIE16_00400 [Phenylobacterium sp.]|jgi:hypothetical protein